MLYRYLVGVVNQNGHFAQLQINLEKPIRGMRDIEYVAKLAADAGIANPTVLAFSRFEGDQ